MAIEPVAWRWKWSKDDFWKYTDKVFAPIPDSAPIVEPLYAKAEPEPVLHDIRTGLNGSWYCLTCGEQSDGHNGD